MRKWGVRAWAAGAAGAAAMVLASGAGAARGGPIQIYVSGTSVTTPIMITGAVTDYGKATSVTKAGKPDENGDYEKIVLQKGTFWIDATALNNKLKGAKPKIDLKNCYFVFTGSGPTSLFKGTGAYAGISGKVDVTVTFAGIGPKTAAGKCNQKVQPVAQYGSVTGSGTASY